MFGATDSTAGSGSSGAYFTAVQKTEETLYGTASKTTRTEYQYDAYGNLLREIYHGDLATTEDDRNLARNYNQNPAIHLVDRIRWEKLWAGTGDGNPGEEVAYTVFGYDHTDPFTGTPTQGNLTEQRAYWATNPAYEYTLTTFAYNSRGVVSTVTNPNNQTTTTQFHSFYGYANQETNPLTHVVMTEMNPGWGVVTKVTDANGKVTEIAYDAYGRLVQVWLPGQPTSGPASLEYIYNPAARPAHAQGRQLFEAGTGSYLDNWTYVDGFGREIQSQRPAEASGQRVLASSQYDNLGRLALRSEAYEVSGTAGSGYLLPTWSNLASYHHFSYDELGHQILDALLTGGVTLWSVSDDFDVWQQVHLDANGRQTDYHYDAFGQLRQVVEYNDEGSGPVQYTTSYDYNRRGDLVKVTDHAGNMTTMSYDLLSRKTGMVDPDMGAWQYQYDPAGDLVAQQDGRGWWLHFIYDALGRLTARRRDSIAGPLVTTYSYDAGLKGFLDYSRAYDDSGTVVEVEVQAVARDDRYQVTEKRWLVHNAGAFRMAYGYNAGGQMTSIQYPADNNDGLGEVVQRGYDAVGQLESVVSLQDGTRFLDQVTYLAAGQVAQLRLDQGTNGATLDFTYQAGSLRLDEKKASSGGGSAFDLQHLTFAYDNGGNITTIVDGRNGGQKQCFGYDWLDRLTSAFTGNADCSAYSGAGAGPYDHDYAYDPIGNITSFDGAGYTYGSQPHAVTAAHGNAYGYDAAGNQTSRTIDSITYTLVYDYESRLAAVQEGSNVLAEFIYDADGARVVKRDDNGLTIYLDGLYEYFLPQPSGSPAGSTYYETQGGAMALRRVGYPADNGIFYVLSDHLGSTSLILAQDGTLLKRDYYYPYGGNRGTPYTDVTTRRFTGQYHEAGLPGGEGLSFYNARWYDPQLGRFISADSLVPAPNHPQDFNRYTYASGNPVRYSDPSGHICYDPGLGAAMPGNCNGGSKPSPTLPHATRGMLGIRFTGSWSPSQRYIALNVAIKIDVALWRAGNFKGRYVAGATFRAVYGNVTLRSSDVQEYWEGKPIGARTNDRHTITFYAAGLNASTINFRYNLAHELGHAFNGNALSPDPTPENPNRLTGRPYRDLRSEGISVGRVLVAGGTPYQRTTLGYQFGPNNESKPYRQNTDWAPGEDFADMFASWAFNSFSNDNYGTARRQWMNNHMSSWISLAVAANP